MQMMIKWISEATETRSWSQEKTVDAESEMVMKPRHMKREMNDTAT